MPKPKNKYDRKHLHNLDVYQEHIDDIYAEAVKEAAAIGVSLGGVDTGKPFTFDDHPKTRKRVNALLEQLRNQLQMSIINAVRSEWTLSNNKNNELCNVVFGNNVGKLPEEQYRRYYSTNEKAREAFIARKERGLGLSDRVWNCSNTFRREMEMGLDLGIREGLDAPSMARDLKQYLKHPDKLFRRVRDEHGNLHLSKNAADFHPGRGMYRSSYLNARRLAATEANTAYRTADHERWKQMDFVVGIEVHLSSNHTCKGRDGKPHAFTDICDQLKGKYPKDFKFTGWHPHCRCYATSVLKTDEEIAEDTKKILRGEPVDGESVNEVKEPPKGFSDWVEKNEGRIAEARKNGTLPGWVKENEERVSGVKNITKGNYASREEKAEATDEKGNTVSSISASEEALIAEESVAVKHNVQEIYKSKDFNEAKDVSDVLNKINEILPKEEKWSVNGDFSLGITDDPSVNGKTSRDGIILLTKERLERVQTTFRKIAQGQVSDILEEEADAMATLWHEIVHNRHVGLESAGEKHSVSERCMELANEWYARHNLKVFYGYLGLDKVPHSKFITHRKSTAYDQMVKNFDHVIGIMRLDRKEVMASLENSLFKGKYDDMENGLYKALFDGGMKNLNDVVLPEDQAKELLAIVRKKNPEDITKWLIKNNYLKSD